MLCPPRSIHRAFSLIELLVVVLTVALLIGLLLPSLSRARVNAHRVACQSNLRQVAFGIAAYSGDYHGLAPRAAPHELGGPTGRCDPGDPWLPPHMFGGTLEADQRPLNTYVTSRQLFRSPADRGEPLWWFDTQPWQASATAFEMYGSSYFYASGYNRMTGVAAPMGIAKFVGVEFSYGPYVAEPLPLGQSLRLNDYRKTSGKLLVGSIPIHRTIPGVVAPNPRAQWYLPDPDHLWANAGFVDGHVTFLKAFPAEPGYAGVYTIPDPANPYY